ncbi:uncharacterized protein LDX57_003014 [Aspergillus melleus]|uniref:uncharacterized protein n=1 Tax=Aspergillus melleus TaxID=138277 RepID=UPI001E8CDAB3|nr:uncharacterized protein LDX57_003014 [Aspergillus melleus]KAH8425258.1 hypothetical protein LDX57_003014 [Aspergillus melleus]
MAIGLLRGEQHSSRHDLEALFWVLFWICIHYKGPNESARVVERFDIWNYADPVELSDLKTGLIHIEGNFIKRTTKYFTEFYQPLVPWVNRLRRQVFPMDKPLKKDDPELHSNMKQILPEAQEAPEVFDV